MGRLGDLIDRHWPRLPLGLLAAAALVVLVSLATAPGPSGAEQVIEVVDELGAAAADRDGEAMCAALTPGFREQIDARIGDLDCEQHARSFGIGVPGRELRDAPRDPPQIKGSTASVLLASIGRRLDLERTDEGWRVGAIVDVGVSRVRQPGG